MNNIKYDLNNLIRLCPNCNKEIKYKGLRRYKQAIINNSYCKKCAQLKNKYNRPKGELSPLYGKKRPEMCGNNNPAKRPEVRKKISESNKGRIGVMTNKKHKQESKDKCRLSNLGKKRSSKTKENIRQAILKQIAAGKNNNPWIKRQKYLDTILHYQSTYELDFLNKYFNKYIIENGKSIYYIFNNEKRLYMSDFYLPEYNLIIEIKSSYTYNKELNKNLCKQNEALKAYNFLFIINKDYTEFEKFIINYKF